MPFKRPEESDAQGRQVAGHRVFDRPLPAEAQLAAVETHVAAMRQALLGSEQTPIEDCMPALEQAATELRDLERAFRTDSPALQAPQDKTKLRGDLLTLRKDLAVVAKLAQSGAALYQGLGRLLGSAAGGYTAQGDGAPLQPASSVLVRG